MKNPFKRKVLTANEIAERDEDIKVRDEANARRIRKLNIDPNNPDVNYNTLDLSMSRLQSIFSELAKTGRYSGIHGEQPKDQRCKSSYRVDEVQELLDYAIGCRRSMDWLMRTSIECGIAEYDSDGIFIFKDVE
tara:strand:+ start:40 stop:441 length:402 start_codon:yes stop_codon:yes gene_type:complete